MNTPPSFLGRGPLGRTVWRFRREFLWAGAFSFFANLLMLTPTLYMLQVFDRVLASGSDLTLTVLTLIAVCFFFVMGFAEWVRSRLLVRAGAKFDEALSAGVFDATFDANLRQGARASTQPFTDLTNVRQFLTGAGVIALFDLPWMVIYIAVLYLMHPWLGHAAVAFAVLTLAMGVFGQRVLSPRFKSAQGTSLELSEHLSARLRNAEVVQALGMMGNLRRHWLAIHDRDRAVHADAFDTQQRLQAATKFVQYTQSSLILSLGALLAIDGHIGVGAMVAANALSSNALRPIGVLVGAWKQFVDARSSYVRMDKLLIEAPAGDGGHSGDVAGQISVRDLVASAPGRAAPILKGLSAEFVAGEVVAIVGPSGAGKSTLARCLLGIWPGTKGEVLLDGRPINDWSRQALGPHLGYLPQDIEMFDGSIAENIARFGKPDSNQVIEAASRTGIHEMILRLPGGYDTQMGEAGSLLSGGQRQRVGLARALYGNPQVVVLDEPNASLDDAGEAALVKTLLDLKREGRTVFMVCHQRQMLSAADRVLLLDNGNLAALAPVPRNPQPAARMTEASV